MIPAGGVQLRDGSGGIHRSGNNRRRGWSGLQRRRLRRLPPDACHRGVQPGRRETGRNLGWRAVHGPSRRIPYSRSSAGSVDSGTCPGRSIQRHRVSRDDRHLRRWLRRSHRQQDAGSDRREPAEFRSRATHRRARAEASGRNPVSSGRFGWKDQHASLVSFSADAYLNEMGITSPLQPVENTSNGEDVSRPRRGRE